MTAFEDIANRFQFTLDMLSHNLRSIREGMINPQEWYHAPTLARWLYGSSQQFMEDYLKLTKKYECNDVRERDSLEKMDVDLSRILEKTRMVLREKFSQDKLLMGATA